MTKITKTITFSTYHVNICTDMGYMFMMTKNQSVKQININKNVLNHYQIYWKRSQHIHSLKTSMISVLINLTIGEYKYISFPDHTFFSRVDQMNPVFALVKL
jgi:hypothetical protein